MKVGTAQNRMQVRNVDRTEFITERKIENGKGLEMRP